VQGVGFRWWTRRLAQGLGLAGDVRNCADGSVEVQAEGELERLGALEAELWKGPPGSRVDAVEAIAPRSEPLGPGFTIEGC
jgi:acylphosphatase